MERKALAHGAWITYDSAWLEAEEADALQDQLTAELAWEHRPIVVFGKEILQPRLVAWAGELPYKYSGQTLPPVRPHPAVSSLIERVSAAADAPFNHVLFNRYRDGSDHMAFHSDNEPELGKNPVIAAISLGARRRFVLAQKKNRSKKRNYRLSHGSLFVMGGTIQHTWRHAVPKQMSLSEERINITFRYLKGPPGWRGD